VQAVAERLPPRHHTGVGLVDGLEKRWYVPRQRNELVRRVVLVAITARGVAGLRRVSIAHKGAVVGAKVMAASVLDLLTSPELLAAAKKQFEQDTKDTKYFSLLPPGAKPPVDLNKDIMDRYRTAMSKFYLNKKAQFK
jgi:hypothetical protein